MTTSSSWRAERREQKRQFGWIEKTISGIAGAIEQSVFTEEHAHKAGWLQARNPRAKLVMFLALVLAAGLSHSLLTLIALYLALLVVARLSKIPYGVFVKRVWIGIPFFAGIVIIPSIFFASDQRWFDLTIGSLHLGPSWGTVLTAAIFVARVGVSVSLAVLLILTTPWSDLMKSLRAFHVPQVFILLLTMTYRYIFLFLHTANGLFEARKSRTVGITSGNEQRSWVSSSITSLMQRSFKMSNDVYAAMAARGFKGGIYTYHDDHIQTADWLAAIGAVVLAVVVFLLGNRII
jgi:cobalt/nickel transport system permease protein